MTDRSYVVDYIEEFELEVAAEWEFETQPEADAFAGPLEPLSEFAGGRVIGVQMMKSMEPPFDAPAVVEVRLAFGYPYIAELNGQAIGDAWDRVRARGARQIRVDATKRSTRVVRSA